jgi:hypothetical protein
MIPQAFTARTMLRPLVRVSLVGLLLVAVDGCSAKSGSGERTNRSVITQAQIKEHGFLNAYDAVESLRSTWLRTRGTDSMNKPTEVQVYLDDNRLGGVQTLKQVVASQIVMIQYIDGLAATARWGLDHGQGVIQIVTHF